MDQALTVDPSPRLKLATHWDLARSPGGAPRAAQLAASWARIARDPTLIIHASGPEDVETIQRFTRQLHGLSAAMLATRVFASDGKTDITSAINASVKSRVEAMNALDLPQLQRGQAVDLVCVDPSTMARLRPFYHPNAIDSFRSPSEFEGLVKRLIARNSPTYFKTLDPLIRDLAVATRELFMNTHLHARHDVHGKQYRRGIRGVTVAERHVPRELIGDFSEGIAPLADYLNSLKDVDDRHTLKMVEVTVIDSGPGFAARRIGRELADDLALSVEHRLVQECFLKNVTSMREQGYGLGLTRVLHSLKTRRGFLSLRTGRLSLYKSFPPTALFLDQALQPQDFLLEGAERADGGTTWSRPTAGTVVTLLIPVGLATS